MKKSFSIKKALSNVGDVFAKSWRHRRKEGPSWDTRANARDEVQPLIETLFCFWTKATHENWSEFADTPQAQQSFLVAQFEKAIKYVEEPRRQPFQEAYYHFEMGFVELTKCALKEAMEEFRKAQKSAILAYEHAIGLQEKAEATRLLIATSLAVEAGEKDKVKEKIQHHLKKFYHVGPVHSAFWKKTSRSTMGRLLNKFKSGEKAESTLHVVFGIWYAAKKVVHFPLDRPRRKGRSVPFPATWHDFWQAASDGDHEEVLRFLDEGVPIDCANEGKWTALIHCAEHGHMDTVKILLDKGANANTHDRWGYTPLLKACEKGQYGAAMELILHKANPNSIPTNGMSPLMYACKDGQYQVAECLIGLRADVRSISQVGWTPIGMAEKAGHHDIAELLRKHLASGTVPKSPFAVRSKMPHVTPIREWHEPGQKYLVDSDDEPPAASQATMEVGPPSPLAVEPAAILSRGGGPKSERRQLHSPVVTPRSDSENEGAGVGMQPRIQADSRQPPPEAPRDQEASSDGRGGGRSGRPFLRKDVEHQYPPGTYAHARERSAPVAVDSAREVRTVAVDSAREVRSQQPTGDARPAPASLSLPNLNDANARASFPVGRSAATASTSPVPSQQRAPSFPTPHAHRWSPPRSPQPSPNTSFTQEERPPYMQASVTPPTFSPSPISPTPAPPLIPHDAVRAARKDAGQGLNLALPRPLHDPVSVLGVPRGSPPPPSKTSVSRYAPGAAPSLHRFPPSPPTRTVDSIFTPPPARTSPPYHLWAMGGYLPGSEHTGEARTRWSTDALGTGRGGEDLWVASADDGWEDRRERGGVARKTLEWPHGPSPVKQWWREQERLTVDDARLLGTHAGHRFAAREPVRPPAKGEEQWRRSAAPLSEGGAGSQNGSLSASATVRVSPDGSSVLTEDDPWNMRAARRLAKHRDWAARSGIQDMSAGDARDEDHEISTWSNDPIWVSRGVV